MTEMGRRWLYTGEGYVININIASHAPWNEGIEYFFRSMPGAKMIYLSVRHGRRQNPKNRSGEAVSIERPSQTKRVHVLLKYDPVLIKYMELLD